MDDVKDSIATDKILVEKQEKNEMLQEKTPSLTVKKCNLSK